jgi:hypothetical protein
VAYLQKGILRSSGTGIRVQKEEKRKKTLRSANINLFITHVDGASNRVIKRRKIASSAHMLIIVHVFFHCLF